MAVDDEWRAPRWLKIAASMFAVVIAAAVAFAWIQPVQVLPRIRVAPGFSFVDQSGAAYTSESGRGVVTLYTFAPTDCTTCGSVDSTMADIADRLDAMGDGEQSVVEVRLVTIALDRADPAALAAAARRAGADGERWRWIGTDSDAIRKVVVGEGFGRWYEPGDDGSTRFDPGFVIVDGNGVIRGEYRYQTLASDADKLTAHLGILIDEIRYSTGAATVAYEAAHLFLCYP